MDGGEQVTTKSFGARDLVGRRLDNPQAQNGIEFLRTQIVNNMEGFRHRARYNKKRGFALKMGIASFGALTTFMLGVKTIPIMKGAEDFISVLALLLSASIPILTAWDAFYDHRWLWVRYTQAHTALHGLLDDLDYAVTNSTVNDKLDSVYSRFRDILDATNSAWQDKRVSMDKAGGKAE